jgi:Fungal specific transcription factor domain
MVNRHDRLFDRHLDTTLSTREEKAATNLNNSLADGAPMERISQSFSSRVLEEQGPLASPVFRPSPNQQRAHPLSDVQSQHQSIQGNLAQQVTTHSSSSVLSVHQESSTRGVPWYYAEAETTDARSQLPPYDLLYSLVNLYFEQINPWFPILHYETTFKELFGPNILSEADCILLHAMVATTLRFCNDSEMTFEVRMQVHDSSKRKVLLYALENSSVRSVQAMLVLALDLTGSVNGPPAWNLLALISRNIIHLGLAAESTSSISSPTRPSIYTLRTAVLSEPEDWIEDEERRRLFWGAYILDRYATISTAFDFGINGKEIDRRLPCDNALFDANIPVQTSWFSPAGRSSYAEYHMETLGSFAFYCELLGIISRIHQFLKRPVDIGSASEVAQWQKSYRQLDDELSSWRMSLPEQTSEAFVFQSSPESMNKRIDSCWIMLHVTCHTAVMRLHTSAAYPTFRSTFFKPSYNAIQRCIRAAKRVEDLSRWVVGTSRLDALGPPFAFSLWVAARVLLVHASTVEPHTSPDIGVFVSILSQMGRRWRVAERYGEILNHVVQEYQQSRLSIGSVEPQSTAASVKILADMRR